MAISLVRTIKKGAGENRAAFRYPLVVRAEYTVSLEDLEKRLIKADVGVVATGRLIGRGA